MATFDIHDRVNYAVVHSFLNVEPQAKQITLTLTIETEIVRSWSTSRSSSPAW